MKYLTVGLCLWMFQLRAQANLTGLGTYSIGLTTPGSLNRIDFKEDESSYVKGTIALPCTHIRTFTSSAITIDGVSVPNLSLAFYDNKLFKLSCDYSDELKEAFVLKYGQGLPGPEKSFLVCTAGNEKRMVVRVETWRNGNIRALAVHTKGYDFDCRVEEAVRLEISSLQVSALASDCEVRNTNLWLEEFDKALNERKEQQREREPKRVKTSNKE